MNTYKYFLLIVTALSLAFPAPAQEAGSTHLSGVWIGRERDGSRGGKLSFGQEGRLAYLSDGGSMEGRYEIDSTKSPKVLVFYPDELPGRKIYALIQIKSDTEFYVSHLSDTIPTDWVGQDIITFTRK